MTDRNCSTCDHGRPLFGCSKGRKSGEVVVRCTTGGFNHCWEPRLDTFDQVASDMLNTIDESACRGVPVDDLAPTLFRQRLRALWVNV